MATENRSARSIDTSSLTVMDGEGNLFSLTESDGHTFTPMIPEWEFGRGNRTGQFNLSPELANVMAPSKRSRNTNSPLLVMKDGRPFMGLSTPGGDQQLQSLLQVFVKAGGVGDVARAGAGPAPLPRREPLRRSGVTLRSSVLRDIHCPFSLGPRMGC